MGINEILHSCCRPNSGSEGLREHQLEDEAVGAGSETVANAGFDIDGLAVVIDHREEHLLLLAQPREAAELAVIGVMLERDGPSLREIVIDPRRRREIERADAGPTIVNDRVENQIDRAKRTPTIGRISLLKRVGSQCRAL